MTAGDAENGDKLYQDTMLKLLEKKKRLDSTQNTKSYALSTSIGIATFCCLALMRKQGILSRETADDSRKKYTTELTQFQKEQSKLNVFARVSIGLGMLKLRCRRFRTYSHYCRWRYE